MPRGTKPIRYALPGHRFGRLVVLSEGPKRGHHRMVHCACDCGGSKTAYVCNLRSGYTQSCGCFQREQLREALVQHDLSASCEYRIWRTMLARCYNARCKAYAGYGRRGIKVCERWQEFPNFYTDMGPRPTGQHTIERVNNDGDYEPTNCKWATQVEQANNRRSSRFVTQNGERKTIAEWTRVLGVGRTALQTHIARGTWPDQKGGEA